jgi:hypothetical protein
VALFRMFRGWLDHQAAAKEQLDLIRVIEASICILPAKFSPQRLEDGTNVISGYGNNVNHGNIKFMDICWYSWTFMTCMEIRDIMQVKCYYADVNRTGR